MAEPRRLPLLPPQVLKGSLQSDGSREFVHTADVRGRFTTARRVVFALLIALWIALPWLKVRGNPAVFLDVDQRRFYLFGATFNAQDTYLLFFVLTGVGFSLVYVTALLGRVWCGWACPQTVFLEGVYRRIERLVEGAREARIRRAKAPWTFDKVWRRGSKHALYLLASFGIAHIVLSYFTTLPGLLRMMEGKPADHPEAFAWAVAVTAVLYGNFAFFREQLCLAICPYGRLQSALIDADSMVVGYDDKRGEPRGKATAKAAGAAVGDCVDCKRCVAVCPTGIDIRNGLQIDCIGCTACIDACDDIMDRLSRPRGLIRYTSANALVGNPTRVVRPRTLLYTGLLVLGAAVALVVGSHRTSFEANLLRLPGPPYVIDEGTERDSFEIHVVNKTSRTVSYTLAPEANPPATFVTPMTKVEIAPMGNVRVPFFVTLPRASYEHDFDIHVHVRDEASGEEKVVSAEFLGAK